jgi:serine/threonine-protein kinase
MTYKPYWPILSDGTTRVPDAAWRAANPGHALPPVENVSVPWRGDWPIIGTSWIDGQDYALRIAFETGWLLHQPHDDLWEKAARGVDGRFFPWGRTMDALFANVQGTWADRMHPEPVDTFPLDESPYGVRGLGGNASCRCLNSPAGRYPDWRLVRGGSWFKIASMARSTHRNGAPADTINLGTGLRLAAAARLSPLPSF